MFNIKNIILLLYVLLFLPFITYSQDQLLDTSKIWYTAIFEGEPEKINTEVIKLGALQSINDTMYYTVLRSINGNENPDSEYGFMRNDSGKIYYRESINHYERLFYDFNLEPGDTIIVYGIQRLSDDGYDKIKMRLDIITEESFYGINRNVYKFSIKVFKDWESEERWIEGLGSISGLLHHPSDLLGPDGHDLRCVYKNNELIYKRHPDIECILLKNIDDIEYIKPPNPVLLPNPVSFNQTVKIQIKEGILLKLAFFDVTGRKIKELNIDKNSEIQCDKIFPGKGIYFYRISDKNTLIKTGKIIII